jgi:hypothetical protein
MSYTKIYYSVLCSARGLPPGLVLSHASYITNKFLHTGAVGASRLFQGRASSLIDLCPANHFDSQCALSYLDYKFSTHRPRVELFALIARSIAGVEGRPAGRTRLAGDRRSQERASLSTIDTLLRSVGTEGCCSVVQVPKNVALSWRYRRMLLRSVGTKICCSIFECPRIR